MRKNHMKKLLAFSAVLIGFVGPVFAGQMTVGAQFQGWNSSFVQPYNGYEVWLPFSMNFRVDNKLGFYGQTEYGWGNYTENSQTINLANFSDSLVGMDLRFTSFSLPSMLNIGLELPTGDTTWEYKQILANVPTDFVDSRYRGRGFGLNAIYGLSFPAGEGEFGAALGYLYGGAWNLAGNQASSSYASSIQSSDMRMGDSAFLALNHVQNYSNNQKDIIRISAFQSLPSQLGGQNVFQLGTNFNASYAWQDPKGLSFEVGGQAWLAGLRPDGNGNLVAESHYSYGPRFYLVPSYSFGDLAITGRAKYVLSNGYTAGDINYDGGGILLGIEPSYRMVLDSGSALKIFGSYDFIDALKYGVGSLDATFNRWTFGSNFEVKL